MVLLIGIVTLYKTFALYDERKEFNILQGRVPDFNNDIKLTYTIDGERKSDTFPLKESGYLGTNVTCDNGVTASWDNGVWGLININLQNNLKIKCNIDFATPTTTNLSSVIKIGDYVRMNPLTSEYLIPDDLILINTTKSQTINPSELNLWRVIKINEDKTFDAVSEYVSNKKVILGGTTTYLNYIGILNLIAGQYANSNFTLKTRYMGYNGQTEYLDKEKVKLQNPPLINISPSDNSYEEQGGGDFQYQNDVDLVNNALGTLIAKDVKTLKDTPYYLASRNYIYSNNGYYGWKLRVITKEGNISSDNCYIYQSNSGGWCGKDFCGFTTENALRPIITLKSNLRSVGEGTALSPYIL